MIRDEIKLLKNLKKYDLSCFSCGNLNHDFDNCPIIHYIPDKQFIIRKYQHYEPQERDFLFERRKIKSKNALLINSDFDESWFSGLVHENINNNNDNFSQSDEEQLQLVQKSSIELINRLDNGNEIVLINQDDKKNAFEEKSLNDLEMKHESNEKTKSNKKFAKKKTKTLDLLSNEDKIVNEKEENNENFNLAMKMMFDPQFEILKNYKFYFKEANHEKIIRKIKELRKVMISKSPRKRLNLSSRLCSKSPRRKRENGNDSSNILKDCNL